MARTALTQLQDQIEAVRREAYAAGYEAAMQAIRDAAGRAAPSPAGAAATPARRGRPAGTQTGRRRGRPAQSDTAAAPRAASGPRQRGRRRGATGSRPQRGTNARLVEEVLQAFGRPARPTEIRTALQRDKGVEMAFTSIRHALGQLETRGAVEPSPDSKTWRHKGGGVSAG